MAAVLVYYFIYTSAALFLGLILLKFFLIFFDFINDIIHR